MDNRVEVLLGAIRQLRESHTAEDLINAKNALNAFFGADSKCENFLFTVNTDKLPFACVVMPKFEPREIANFMIVGETVNKIDKYDCEIDSKMFDYGLTDEEIAAVILYNVYHMIKDLSPLNRVREAIDLYLTNNVKSIAVKESIQYNTILSLGVYDALNQFTSCLNLPDEVESDPFLESVELDLDFPTALDKLYREIPGCQNEAARKPNLSMLEWCLRLYDNVDKERIPALHVLARAKELTASVLYIGRINAVITALNRIDTDLYVNEAVEMVLQESKKRHGFLANLKYSGLRDIESDLYEFQVRAKNAETENEVMYALKQINARLAILDNYIRENPDDPDLDRWINVKVMYEDIRDDLAKKKLHKRAYGVFVDYEALSQLDDEE